MSKLIKILLISACLIATGIGQILPNDPAGSLENIKTGKLDGNRVISIYQNNTYINNVKNLGTGVDVWPSEYNATDISNETKLLVGGKIYLDANGNPIESVDNIGTANETLHYLESNATSTTGGFAPVDGYFGNGSEKPAISTDPNTWPEIWPDVNWLSGEKSWNGRRGKNYLNANQESYFVANDASYDKHIGKYKPLASDSNRGGLGLRVSTRSMQWKQYPMDNTIVWEYTVSNVSDYDLPDIFIGLYRDNSVGGDEYYSGELIKIDTSIAASFEWDVNFIPVETPDHPGIVALVVTTTPTNENDGIDNDGDGLIDESRNNDFGYATVEEEGLADVEAFKEFYGYSDGDLKNTFYLGDEDRDWQDGVDNNGNGIYEYGFDLPGDDLGKDGIGPYDLGYEGPDEGEGNHQPDLGEPNFGYVDIDEGDIIGLRTFAYMNKSTFDANYGIDREEDVINYLEQDNHGTETNVTSDYIQLLSTKSFVIQREKTTSFSFAEIHSADPLMGLNAIPNDEDAPDIYNRKVILDEVIKQDFQYMKKPVQPIVTATAEDGEITLVWDDVAREFDIQPFLDNEINFEGYKIYKATDIEMKDAKIVTDGYGTPIKYRPVAQYDLVNGISQYIKYGADRGSGYFLGSDVGIKNYFIDTSVKNGVKYYYFVTAYNTGTYKIGNGIAPQESDFNSVTGDFSPNVVAVTPRVQSLGFENADIEILDWNTFGNGFVQPEVFIDANIKPGHTYKAIFESEEGPGGGVASYGPKASIFRTDGLKIYDITDVTDDSSSGTLVYYENNKKYNEKNFYFDRYDAGFWNHTPDGWVVLDTGEILETATFDGLKLKFGVAHQTAKINHYATGWKTGTAPHNLELQTTWDKQFMAFDYDIVFTGNDSEYTSKSNNTTVYDFENKKINNILFGQSYNFYVLNWSILDSLGNPDTADVVTWDKDGNGEFDPLVDAYLIGHTTFFKRGGWKFNSTLLAAILDFNTATSVEELPETGDVFTIRWIRPFFDGDYITFKVNGYKNEQENLIENNLDKIRVVPNPYIFTNSGEENSDIANYERRMMFNNLPENCTIKIYTITGMLIKELRVTPESKSSMSEGQVLDIGNGIAYWDLTNRKGRQVAPGYYIYRVKSDLTGETYMDKFAIIK